MRTSASQTKPSNPDWHGPNGDANGCPARRRGQTLYKSPFERRRPKSHPVCFTIRPRASSRHRLSRQDLVLLRCLRRAAPLVWLISRAAGLSARSVNRRQPVRRLAEAVWCRTRRDRRRWIIPLSRSRLRVRPRLFESGLGVSSALRPEVR
jgi:hypothetical protein